MRKSTSRQQFIGKMFRGTEMQWIANKPSVVNWEDRREGGRKMLVDRFIFGKFHYSCRIRSWFCCRREDSKVIHSVNFACISVLTFAFCFKDGVCVALFFIKTKGRTSDSTVYIYIQAMHEFIPNNVVLLSVFCNFNLYWSVWLVQQDFKLRYRCNEIGMSWFLSSFGA